MVAQRDRSNKANGIRAVFHVCAFILLLQPESGMGNMIEQKNSCPLCVAMKPVVFGVFVYTFYVKCR
jgi:hypothetical protein